MIGGIALAAQAAFGIGQAIAGGIKKRRAPGIPTYQIPSELKANLSESERLAMEGLPEAQKQMYIENIQRGGATMLQQASTRKGGLGLIPTIAEQQRGGYRELLMMDAAERMKRQGTVMGMRERIAEEKFRKHEADTYRAQVLRGEAQELIGAGIQNIGGSLGSAAGLSAMFGGGGLSGGRGARTPTAPSVM
jgi:hypothetical protein